MSKFAALLSVLLLAGCATSPDARTQVTIKNLTMDPLEIKVGSGILGTTVYLPPGGGWSGFIDRRWIGNSAWVEIRPLVPKPLVR